MEDTGVLLATLSQSSAAIVAIIGGFLVSRLVAISSERESIKRQLKAAKETYSLLQDEYQPVHEYRLQNSVQTMEGWLYEDLVQKRAETKDVPIDALLEENIPRGSSLEEMRPYAEALRERVSVAFENILDHVTEGDTQLLEIDDLNRRGLTLADADQDLYEDVFDEVRQALPRRSSSSILGFGIPSLDPVYLGPIGPDGQHEIKMRRLDESIQEEARLRSQTVAAKQEVERLEYDLDVFAQPVGVTSAITILAIFSLLGILLPLAFMAFGPDDLCIAVVALLFGCFVVGLASVLLYIAWYFRKIRN